MDRQQIGLKLALDALLGPWRLDAPADLRLVLHAIYLAQATGVHLGYTFHWGQQGLWSRSLVEDAVAIRNHERAGGDDGRGWKFDPVGAGRVADLAGRLRLIPPADLGRRLQLLASVRFLLVTNQGSVSDPAGMRERLSRYGMDFSAAEMRRALDELPRLSLRE